MATSKVAGKAATKGKASQSSQKGKLTSVEIAFYPCKQVFTPLTRPATEYGKEGWNDFPIDELTPGEQEPFLNFIDLLPEPLQEGTHSIGVIVDKGAVKRDIYGPSVCLYEDNMVLKFGDAFYPVEQDGTKFTLGELTGTLRYAEPKEEEKLKAHIVFSAPVVNTDDGNRLAVSYSVGTKLADETTAGDLAIVCNQGEDLIDLLAEPGGNIFLMHELVTENIDGELVVQIPDGGADFPVTGFALDKKDNYSKILLGPNNKGARGTLAKGTVQTTLEAVSSGGVDPNTVLLPCYLHITDCVKTRKGWSIACQLVSGELLDLEEPEDEEVGIDNELDTEIDEDGDGNEEEAYKDRAEV